MKFSAPQLFLALVGANAALAEFTVIPGKSAVAYCSSNPMPGHDNCERAIAKIDDNGYYSEGNELQAGDCSVRIVNPGAGATKSLKGSDYKYMASSILENGCYGDGWGLVDGVNVTVHLCTVCMYGTCTVCNAPARRAGATLPMVEAKSEMPPAPASRRSIESSPSTLEARADPEWGVTCGSALGPVKVSACKELAGKLRGQELALPYVGENQGCEVALFAHFRGMTISGDKVADRIDHDSDLCNGGGYVGRQVDDNLAFTVIFAAGPRLWFGQLCGEFGFGIAECTQGEAPGK
ncbi:hypothetical protein BGZ61DRAFT_483692 [Ilyonectria robusta]|uniref:uncharacterized protein n=1 Tax=Ilyonectria robusta TaxID=1079257 RepID=UPI001E8DF354|nr:uncharacterized protein BGZ61DRAFT_483692 [Ilyonectria robusta]KAH8667776.1 hypothetical protein BGZ61DRAFT_483692 [Ilyonectria robusta]